MLWRTRKLTMLTQKLVEEALADQYKTAYKKAKAALNSVSSELSGLEVVEGKLADALRSFKGFPGKADSGDDDTAEKDLEKLLSPRKWGKQLLQSRNGWRMLRLESMLESWPEEGLPGF